MTIPSVLAPYTAQLETMTGMTTPQMLVRAAGGFEVIAGLMIALNFGARFFAFLLIIFIALATFYFHDFWNQVPPENGKALIDALKNLSLIGALFIIAARRGPRWPTGPRGRLTPRLCAALAYR